MAKGILKNYSFSTGAKTVTLTDIATVRLDKLALITDVTTNKILYNFADATVATATVATNVITLSTLQGGENNSDKLRIDYDVESSDTSATTDTTAPVSVASLPLPSGASTGAKQDTGNTSLASIDGKIPASPATSGKQDTGNTSLASIDGKITAVNTGAVVISSSALPTLAATSTKQSDGSQKTQVVDGSGNVIGATSNALDINIKSGNPTSITANAGTNLNTSALALESGGNLATIAGTVTSSRAAVNLISGQAGVAANTGAVSATTQRVVQANDAGKTLLSKGGQVSSSGNNTIVSAGTNRLKVFAFSLTVVSTTAVTIKFQDGAGGTVLWQVTIQTPASVSSGANLVVTPPAWLFATSAATLLNINLSVAVAVDYSVSYFDEA